MVLINKDGIPKKYDTVGDIVREFYKDRLEWYSVRKESMLSKLQNQSQNKLHKLEYIRGVVNGSIQVMGVKEKELIEFLSKATFHRFPKKDGSYDYLLNIPNRSFTTDKVKMVEKELKEIEKKIKSVSGTCEKDMWRVDLDVLEKELE